MTLKICKKCILGWTRTTSGLFNLPDQHGLPGDYSAPLGSGLLLLAGMGAAYAMKKRRGRTK